MIDSQSYKEQLNLARAIFLPPSTEVFKILNGFGMYNDMLNISNDDSKSKSFEIHVDQFISYIKQNIS